VNFALERSILLLMLGESESPTSLGEKEQYSEDLGASREFGRFGKSMGSLRGVKRIEDTGGTAEAVPFPESSRARVPALHGQSCELRSLDSRGRLSPRDPFSS
jgi:hypothetical protein